MEEFILGRFESNLNMENVSRLLPKWELPRRVG